MGLLHAIGKELHASCAQLTASPAIGAFTIAFIVNNLVIFTAIALALGPNDSTVVVIESSRSTILLDFLTTPLIFVFAWVYAAFGAIAAAALWVPILGCGKCIESTSSSSGRMRSCLN